MAVSRTSVGERLAQLLVPRCRTGEHEAVSLTVQAALVEYGYLKEETLQTQQRMVAIDTLGLAAAGVAATLAMGQHLDEMEAPVLLVAAALLLMFLVAVLSMSVHVGSASRWMRHIGEIHVQAVIAKSAGESGSIPKDLLGWDLYSRVSAGPWTVRLERFTWLALLPLPSAALVFQVQAWWDWFNNPGTQTVGTALLLGTDAAFTCGAAAFAVAAILQLRAIRSSVIHTAD